MKSEFFFHTRGRGAFPTGPSAWVILVLLGGLGFISHFGGRCLAQAQTAQVQEPAQTWLAARGSGANPSTKTNRAEALRMLDAYAATQDKIRGFIINCEVRTTGNHRLPPPYNVHDGQSVKYEAGEVRWDGVRCCWREYSWGEIFASGSVIRKEDALYNSRLFDGIRDIIYSWSPLAKINAQGTVSIHSDGKLKAASYFAMSTGSELLGYLYDDFDRVDQILRRADELTLERERNAAGGAGCYVIRGKGRAGRYAVWLDPAQDTQIVRAEFHREGGDLTSAREGSKPLPKGFIIDYALHDVQFQKMGGLTIPVEAVADFHRKHSTGHYSITQSHLKRTKINLAPDFKALQAFSPDDVRDGAVSYVGEPVVKYVWQRGKLIPSSARPAPRKAAATVSSRHPKPGAAAPDFELRTVDGRLFKLGEQRGKVVILHFWSALDKQSLEMNSPLNAFHEDLVKKYGGKVVMVGLSLDDDEELIRNFVDSGKLTWPQACLGKGSRIVADYGVDTVPDDFMIGPDGRILLNRESKKQSDFEVIDKALGL